MFECWRNHRAPVKKRCFLILHGEVRRFDTTIAHYSFPVNLVQQSSKVVAKSLLPHLPLPGLEPVGGETLMSVTCGQCDARPTVTFPAARHHRPLAGTKLYCMVTGAHMC